MTPRVRSGGFTYVGLIVLLAILGLVAAAGMKTGSLMQRAAAEQELLEIGASFSDALRSYAAATPQGQPPQPPNLQALLKDPRFPGVRRHLRRIFVDPVTGKAEWGLVTIGDNALVTGVYSLSSARPLKVGNFDARFVNFDNKERISDWTFTATGRGITVLGAPGGPAANALPVPAPAPEPQVTPVLPQEAPPPEPPAAEPVEAPPPEPVEPAGPAEAEQKEAEAEEGATVPKPVAD